MIFPGYRILQGPETLLNLGTDLLGQVVKINTPEDYKLWQRFNVLTRGDKIWTPDNPHVLAYINHGRWVINCVACHKGVLTRPDWNLACCSECGAIYEGTITFPQDPRIEQLLKLRPDRSTQSWDHLQTAEDLLRENKELGLVA